MGYQTLADGSVQVGRSLVPRLPSFIRPPIYARKPGNEAMWVKGSGTNVG